jgi:serine protease inhibitor
MPTGKNWISRFETKSGTIMLPRFSLEYEKSLKDALTELGMKIAFEPGSADFPGWSRRITATTSISMMLTQDFH